MNEQGPTREVKRVDQNPFRFYAAIRNTLEATPVYTWDDPQTFKHAQMVAGKIYNVLKMHSSATKDRQANPFFGEGAKLTELAENLGYQEEGQLSPWDLRDLALSKIEEIAYKNATDPMTDPNQLDQTTVAIIDYLNIYYNNDLYGIEEQ